MVQYSETPFCFQARDKMKFHVAAGNYDNGVTLLIILSLNPNSRKLKPVLSTESAVVHIYATSFLKLRMFIENNLRKDDTLNKRQNDKKFYGQILFEFSFWR